MFKAIFSLIRPLNLLILGFAQLGLLKQEEIADVSELIPILFFILSSILTAAAGNIINDIYDIKTDIINKPNRPLVSKKITIAQAWIFYGLMVFGALFLAYYAHNTWLWVVGITTIVLAMYARYFKRKALQGNTYVSLCVLASLIGTSLFLSESVYPTAYPFILFISLLAFISTYIREIFKTIQDFEGDKAAKFSTFPIQFGIKTSYQLGATLAFLMSLALLVFVFFSLTSQTDSIVWKVLLLLNVLLFVFIGFKSLQLAKTGLPHKAKLLVHLSKIQMLSIVIGLFL